MAVIISMLIQTTNEAKEDNKEEWYEQLQMAVSKLPQHDRLLITCNTTYERAVGTHGHGTRNNNGECLADFCLSRNIFLNKDIHKLTWKSPDGRTIKQIDHFIVNSKQCRIPPRCESTSGCRSLNCLSPPSDSS